MTPAQRHARKVLVNRAGAYLLDAMEKFTREQAEMTALEWMEAMSTIMDRFRRDALRDEWEGPAPVTEDASAAS